MIKQGIGKVLTKAAPTNTQCVVNVSEDESYLKMLCKIDRLKAYSYEMYVFAYTLLSGGLRVSELLSIKGTDVLISRKLIVKGLKGSKNRLIDVSFLWFFYSRFVGTDMFVFANFDRFFVYRIFLKYNVVFFSEKSSKKSVTHSLRHVYINSLRASNLSDADLCMSIGHNNVSNVNYYGKEKK